MQTTLGIALIAIAVPVLLAVWFPLRRRLSPVASDMCSALVGAAIGVGGLLLLTDVGINSWLLTPPFLALCAVVHRRAMFAGDGPLRV